MNDKHLKRKILILTVLSLSSATLMISSQTFGSEPGNEPGKPGTESGPASGASLGSVVSISQKDSTFVILNAGPKQGLRKDMILVTSRSVGNDKSIPIPTGRIQVVEVSETSAVAKNLGATTTLAQSFFPKHPGLMVGDLIQEEIQELTENQVAAPVLRFPYQDLFRDPGKSPQIYALSEQGRVLLAQAAQQLFSLRPEQIVIEAFTDALGDAQDNLYESTQRAQVVRQFLIESQTFHPEQILSFGLGEGESDQENFAKNLRNEQRFLLIRASSSY